MKRSQIFQVTSFYKMSLLKTYGVKCKISAQKFQQNCARKIPRYSVKIARKSCPLLLPSHAGLPH